MFGTLGVQEMVIIFFVALVLFGPKKLPELGKTIGKALTEFRRHSNDLKSTFEREMNNLEKETEPIHQAASSAADQIHSQIADVDPYQHWLEPGQTTLAPTAAIEGEVSGDIQATIQPHETVSASEVAGAESTGGTEMAAIEGTVPRTGPVSEVVAAKESASHPAPQAPLNS